MSQLIDGLALIYNQHQNQPALAIETALSKYGPQLASLKQIENKVAPFLLAERFLGPASDDLEAAKKQFRELSQDGMVEISPLVIQELLNQKQEIGDAKKELEEKMQAGRWEYTTRERDIAETFVSWSSADWTDPHLVDFVQAAMKRVVEKEKPAEKEEKRAA